MPVKTKLETKRFWNRMKAISRGAATRRVPAAMTPHCDALSAPVVKLARPTVRTWFEGEVVALVNEVGVLLEFSEAFFGGFGCAFPELVAFVEDARVSCAGVAERGVGVDAAADQRRPGLAQALADGAERGDRLGGVARDGRGGLDLRLVDVGLGGVAEPRQDLARAVVQRERVRVDEQQLLLHAEGERLPAAVGVLHAAAV